MLTWRLDRIGFLPAFFILFRFPKHIFMHYHFAIKIFGFFCVFSRFPLWMVIVTRNLYDWCQTPFLFFCSKLYRSKSRMKFLLSLSIKQYAEIQAEKKGFKLLSIFSPKWFSIVFSVVSASINRFYSVLHWL